MEMNEFERMLDILVNEAKEAYEEYKDDGAYVVCKKVHDNHLQMLYLHAMELETEYYKNRETTIVIKK